MGGNWNWAPQIFHKIPCLGFFLKSLSGSVKGIVGVWGCPLSPIHYRFNQVRVVCVLRFSPLGDACYLHFVLATKIFKITMYDCGVVTHTCNPSTRG